MLVSRDYVCGQRDQNVSRCSTKHLVPCLPELEAILLKLVAVDWHAVQFSKRIISWAIVPAMHFKTQAKLLI